LRAIDERETLRHSLPSSRPALTIHEARFPFRSTSAARGSRWLDLSEPEPMRLQGYGLAVLVGFGYNWRR
jgi:hypothetical protein